MGRFKKPSRKLNKFLKKENSGLERKDLSKLTLGIATGAITFNLLMYTPGVFAHSNTHTNTPHSNTTFLQDMDIPGTKCFKVVPAHTNIAAEDTGHSSG
ncbi:MAG: hypothetical protein K9L61_00235 [Candidatus Omnitrophica bacterium]|nr:hypothetical protein [Candidatus Omnitrophota bacterium]